MKPGRDKVLVAILLCFFCGAAVLGMRHKSATIDEFAHLPAGYYYWLTRDFSLYSKNPPLVKMLASLPLVPARPEAAMSLDPFPRGSWRPWYYATDFMRANRSEYTRLIFLGRLPIVLVSAALGILVYVWSRRLYGPAAGLISLFCFCMSPNMLAHAMLATVDAGASLFLFAATFALFEFLRRPGVLRALPAGLCLGLAQLSKFTALFWILFYIIFTAAAVIRPPRNDYEENPSRKPRHAYLVHLVIILFVTWLVMAAGYGFKGVFRPVSGYRFYSSQMKNIQSVFSFLPAPFAETYLKGLDLQILDSERGEFSNYLLGEWYRGRRWYYYIVALIFKVPVPFQVMFLVALLAGRRARAPGPGRKKWSILPEEAGLLFIMLFISGVFSLRSSLQIGVRYLLPLFPFAFVLMGRLATITWLERPRARLFVWVLFLWAIASNLFIYPDYLAYFNELCLGPRNGHRILLDSNLDWGQDLPGLADYMEENHIEKIHLAYFGHVDPGIYGIDYDLPALPPVHEYTAVSAQLLYCFEGFRYPLTYNDDPEPISSELLRPYSGQEPVASIGYSINVFRNPVTQEPRKE